MYESVGCLRSKGRPSLHPRTPTSPPVVTHLDFHSCKRQLITDAYARPGAVNVPRPWRHPTQPATRVEAGGVTPSRVRSVIGFIFVSGTCRKSVCLPPRKGFQHKLHLLALIVKLNCVFLEVEAKHAHICVVVVVVVFSRSCRLAFHFILNLNDDRRKPLCLTKQIHYLAFRRDLSSCSLLRLLFSPFAACGLLSAACSTALLVFITYRSGW